MTVAYLCGAPGMLSRTALIVTRGHRGQTPCYLETCHQSDYCVVQIGLATDGVSLPLGFHMYAPNATWADDAVNCSTPLMQFFPIAAGLCCSPTSYFLSQALLV